MTNLNYSILINADDEIMVAYLLSLNRCHWKIAKVKNYNFNVTEVLVWDFKNALSGFFNFTVGILSSCQRLSARVFEDLTKTSKPNTQLSY